MSDIPKTCKAAVLVEYGKPDVISEVEIPQIAPGGILVKVRLAGICGTDVHQQIGDLGIKAPLPNIQGHETLAEIIELGEGRTADVVGQPIKVGDRIMWAHAFCGECYYCKILRKPFMCAKSRGYGFAPPQALRGGFAEYVYVDAPTEIVRVPDEITDEEAVGVGCAFRTVVNGFEKLNRHGGINPGDTVVVQGAGPVGLYAAVLAAQSGAAKVVVIGAPAERLELAKKFGATDTINIEELKEHEDRVKKIISMTDGRGAEVVIECAGFPSAFVQGFDFLMKSGIFLVMGQTSTAGIEIVPNVLLAKQAVVLGSGSADITHFYKALKFIKAYRHKYPFDAMISKTYALEQVNEALSDMRKGLAIKAAIDCRNR
jgi:D-arabinose 1-dehydrogenase-like Zn-dependent alcohol dehydrogenase